MGYSPHILEAINASGKAAHHVRQVTTQGRSEEAHQIHQGKARREAAEGY